uniref:Secreted protein n=1 Tax=Myripristis murdjan TaxID=586833 RepID=A0A667WYQ9_9TELE
MSFGCFSILFSPLRFLLLCDVTLAAVSEHRGSLTVTRYPAPFPFMETVFTCFERQVGGGYHGNQHNSDQELITPTKIKLFQTLSCHCPLFQLITELPNIACTSGRLKKKTNIN